jgi:hypothetical protein
MENKYCISLIFILCFLLTSKISCGQKSHSFGVTADSKIFIHKGLVNQINNFTDINKLSLWREMTGPFYKYSSLKWGFEASVTSNWYDEEKINNWDISHNVNSLILGVDYNLGNFSFADKLYIHSGIDILMYDLSLRNVSYAKTTPFPPNSYFLTNVSTGLILGIESLDYLNEDGIFYNLRLGYAFVPNSGWKGGPVGFSSSLEYVYFGLGFGFDNGYKKRQIKKSF